MREEKERRIVVDLADPLRRRRWLMGSSGREASVDEERGEDRAKESLNCDVLSRLRERRKEEDALD